MFNVGKKFSKVLLVNSWILYQSRQYFSIKEYPEKALLHILGVSYRLKIE